MTTIYPAKLDSNILNSFGNAPSIHQHKMKTLSGQTVKNTIDFSKFLTESHSKINDLQKEAQNNTAMNSMVTNWHEKVSRVNEEYRFNLRNLGKDLAEIYNQNSPELSNDIKNLANSHLANTNFKNGYVNP